MLTANPYLQYAPDRIYNPLNDKALTPADPAWAALRAFLDGSPSPHHAARTVSTRLLAAGFAEIELGGAWS